MNTLDRGRLFRAYPVLRSLPAALLGRVDAQVSAYHLPPGHALFEAGAHAKVHPLLADGTVRVSKADAEGHSILLYRLMPGESCVISATTLLAGTTYPASGTAETNLRLYTLPRNVFVQMVLESEAWRGFVFASVATKIARLMVLIDDLVFHRVDQRLAHRLLDGPQPLLTTHQTLAEELGTSREVVSRILQTFQGAGAIRQARRCIEVVDRDALARIRSADGTLRRKRPSSSSQ